MDGDGVCCGVLRGGTEEGKRGRGAAASSSSFLRGAGEAGGGGGRATWPTHGGSRARAGGPCRLASGARPARARNRRTRATCAVRALPAEQRGRGEADG
jgi:hypothetical protein